MGRMGLVKARKNDWLLYFEQLPFGNATGENWRRELCECWQMPPWKTWTAILERSNDRLWQTQHDSIDFILGTGHLLTVQWPEEMIWYGQMMAVNCGTWASSSNRCHWPPMAFVCLGGTEENTSPSSGLQDCQSWRYVEDIAIALGAAHPGLTERKKEHSTKFSQYIYIYISCICIWFAAKVMGTCSEYCLMSLKIASSFIDTPIELDDTLGGWLSVMFPKPWWVLTMFYPWQKTTEHVFFFLRILWVYWMTVIILFYMCRTAPNKRESLEQLGNSWGADINLGKISARTREPSEVWFRTILRGHLGKKTQKS